MRIDRVVARAFGPWRDETLELAPGLTVIAGPNESGKTSWHAAIRAAICGTRRGRGALTRPDAEFQARHRPWDEPERWAVEARLSLEDGRRIDISQDLAGKVACRAVEVGRGRDVSHEILDGTPDASRWLGLDRDAFGATVCVGQAQILAVAQSAEMLQEHMQRAAATRGTDATAAEAIERLTLFRREKVGLDRENARGPLRVARNRLAQARDELEAARRQHGEYVELVTRLDASEHAAEEAHGRLRVAEAALVARDAEAARRRASRARELAERHPSPPPDRAARDAVADRVAAALAAWDSRPTVSELSGRSAAELERELAELPAAPEGDLEPDPEMVAARRELERAADALALFAEGPPTAGLQPPPVPRRPAPTAVPLLVSAGLGVAAVGLLAMGLSPAAAMAGALALLVAGWALLRARGAEGLEAARRRSDELALAERREALERRVREATDRLGRTLASRGVEVEGDLAAVASRYEDECRARAAVAALAGRAEPLRAALASRIAAERAVADAAEQLATARTSLHAAAEAVGVRAAELSDDELVRELAAWRERRDRATRLADQAMAEWQELQSLLAGSSLPELEARAAELAGRSEALTTELGAPPPVATGGELERMRDQLRERHAALRREADELAGGLEMLSGRLPDVAEREEALALAQDEWDRIQALATTIDRTLALLRAAQERVHSTLAPLLASSLLRWLPEVCGGRYVDVAVDPADLAVRVKEAETGRWRDAQLLSEGTREQIYLLLRVAMAQHLATTGETAPLLLDEVTAQSDADRRERLLEVLHSVSRERQVILFSHDAAVATWAAKALTRPEDRLVWLEAPTGAGQSVAPLAVASA